MKNKIVGLLALTSFLGIAAIAKADKDFRQDHPRRSQINRRVKWQKHKVRKELREGEISKQQARQDIKQINAVKSQEKADVKANGGYLTKQQQQSLNQNLGADNAANLNGK